MHYVQYYEYNLAGKLDHALGDRGVVILDGRQNLSSLRADAVSCNGRRRPTYPAYRLYRGESFTRSSPIDSIQHVE